MPSCRRRCGPATSDMRSSRRRPHERTSRDRNDRSPRITAALFVLAAAAVAITVATLGLVLARGSAGRATSSWRGGASASRRASERNGRRSAAGNLSVGGPRAFGCATWLLSPSLPWERCGRSTRRPRARCHVRCGSPPSLSVAARRVDRARGLAIVAARRHAGNWKPASSLRRLVRLSKRPEVDEGIRAAYGTNRGAGLVVSLAGSAVAVFLAALVFGTSLSALTSTPVRYGWPWDVAAIGNFGFGGFDLHKVAATLDHRRDVRSWAALGFSSAIIVDRDAVPALISSTGYRPARRHTRPGRAPTAADDEIAPAHRSRRPCRVGRQGHGLGIRGCVTARRWCHRRASVVGPLPSRPGRPVRRQASSRKR